MHLELPAGLISKLLQAIREGRGGGVPFLDPARAPFGVPPRVEQDVLVRDAFLHRVRVHTFHGLQTQANPSKPKQEYDMGLNKLNNRSWIQDLFSTSTYRCWLQNYLKSRFLATFLIKRGVLLLCEIDNCLLVVAELLAGLPVVVVVPAPHTPHMPRQ